MEPPKIWRERRERYLAIGTKCLDCNKISFPFVNYCPECSSENTSEHKLTDTGKIVFFTQVTLAAKEMISYSPYTVGIIELDDGIRLTGQIVDCKYEDLKEDMKVRMIFRILSTDNDEGLIRYGFKFKPD